MGLFSRKEAKSSRAGTHRPRPSVSSEAQAASMRVRARRRLTGAVALVLAAVIVLPMLLDGEPRPVPAGIEIVVPERNAMFNPVLEPAPAATEAPSDSTVAGQVSSSDVSVDPAAQPAASTDANQPQADKPKNGVASDQVKAPTKPTNSSQTPEAMKAEPPKPEPKADNTAVAMAILEGKSPASSSGNYVLQIASYAGEADARSRVDKLKSQGVSNAFVQNATVNSKTTYRLRVGPFDSRAAAQAAQARLRTLGYDNGFITTK